MVWLFLLLSRENVVSTECIIMKPSFLWSNTGVLSDLLIAAQRSLSLSQWAVYGVWQHFCIFSPLISQKSIFSSYPVMHPYTFITIHDISPACWNGCNNAAVIKILSKSEKAFSLSISNLSMCMWWCVHRRFMHCAYLQYPGELYIAPNRVCNLIRIVFRGCSTLCVSFHWKSNISPGSEHLFIFLDLFRKARLPIGKLYFWMCHVLRRLCKWGSG